MYDLLNIINLVVTLMLIGLIWTVQLVHYPSFHYVQPEMFTEFERQHSARISIIVMPLMLCEISVSALLLHSSGYAVKYAILLGIVVMVWLATALLSVPCHRKLAAGKDEKTITRLVNTNWVRTVLWSLKGILLAAW